MGTHPIFESDFDCLTECIKMNNDEAIVVEHNTTDRIESLYDDIRSVEKRLGHAPSPPPITMNPSIPPPGFPPFGMPPMPGMPPPPYGMPIMHGMPPHGMPPGVPAINYGDRHRDERRPRRRSRSRSRSRRSRSRSKSRRSSRSSRRSRSRDRRSRSRSRGRRSRSPYSLVPERKTRKSPSPFRSSLSTAPSGTDYTGLDSYDTSIRPPSPGETNDIIKLRETIFELENVIKLKDEQLEMKEERSRIKDRTIDQLKRDLEDQYYRQNSNEEVLRLQRELEDAKNAISMYDSNNQSSGQLESGEKFQMIKEIRQKSKSLREVEEKVDTLKKREV